MAYNITDFSPQAQKQIAEQMQGIKQPKEKKHKNEPITIDGHYFPSKKEANYYCDLKLRHRANDILGFGIQIKFPLLNCFYVADFVVWNTDGTVDVIDTKGMRTDTYIVKIKAFKELYPQLRFREE